MATKASQKDAKSQTDKFVETARELEADEDEARWEKRLKKVVDKAQKEPQERRDD